MTPIRGRAESVDNWGIKLRVHLEKSWNEVMPFRRSIIFKTFGKSLIGLCATDVDKSFQIGDQQYSQMSKRTERKFKCVPRKYDKVWFARV